MVMGKRGQAAAVDTMLIFLMIAIFAVGVWGFYVNGQAPASQAQRSRQDFTKSLLVTILYASPSPESGKSLSDIIAMHLTNPEKVPEDVVIKNLKAAKINEYLSEKLVDTQAEWFLYGEYREQGFVSAYVKQFCFHGKGESVEKCAQEKVEAKVSSSAAGSIVFINPSTVSLYLRKVPVFLSIKWS